MTERLPQLYMRQPDITLLPPLVLPEGFALHTHITGSDAVWEQIIEATFGKHFSFQDFIVNGGGYQPEYVQYISKNGKDIATATAIENEKFPGEGWFRMIATIPEARGQGAGRLVCLAALHSLAARGYKSVLLSTDDVRIPAISLYLSLGFRPYCTHSSHKERWEKVFDTINSQEALYDKRSEYLPLSALYHQRDQAPRLAEAPTAHPGRRPCR